MKTIERYSIGTGDRFGRQGAAQIAAVRRAREKGVDVAIVWNKSNREHLLTGTEPADQGAAAAQAIKETGWDGPWYVDADHIGMATVDRFAPHCDFFTIDVADFIGKSAAPEAIDALRRNTRICPQLQAYLRASTPPRSRQRPDAISMPLTRRPRPIAASASCGTETTSSPRCPWTRPPSPRPPPNSS
jgi:DNA-binding NarL/FixJ family response regulator